MARIRRICKENNLITCVNKKCQYYKIPFYVDFDDIHDEVTHERDERGKELTLEAIKHRDKNRVRCVGCEYIYS